MYIFEFLFYNRFSLELIITATSWFKSFLNKMKTPLFYIIFSLYLSFSEIKCHKTYAFKMTNHQQVRQVFSGNENKNEIFSKTLSSSESLRSLQHSGKVKATCSWVLVGSLIIPFKVLKEPKVLKKFATLHLKQQVFIYSLTH